LDPTKTIKSAGWLRELREWSVSIGVAVVLAMLIQTYAFAQTEVKNVSMEGTLVEGQRLIEDKISYHFSRPSYGDIVIINGPESDRRLIKRVIGVQGDLLNMIDGRLYRNGAIVDEPYAQGSTYPLGTQVPYTVPEGKVFVMGDNRENSMDSRDLGPVSISSLEGKAVFRLWPFKKIGDLN
jgi:signal peptidase I